jgi:membrane protein
MNHLIEQQSKNVVGLIHAVETRASANPLLHTLIQAARAYSEDHCSLIAAALSYYALLSIFPLMLLLLSEASNFFPPDRLVRAITSFIAADLPVSATFLQTTLKEVIQLRGAVTTVSAIGFLWSAAGVFDMIQLGINRAFRVQRDRPRWRQRLVSMGMVISISFLFAISLLITTGFRLGIHYHLIERHDALVEIVTAVGTFLISIGVFGLLYRHLPFDAHIGWRQVFLGAVISAILWETAKLIFAWYVTNYALLNLVYGSIGAVIAIMLWCYVTAAIMLIGAEVAAVTAGARQREKKGDEWWAITAP